jgi:hypothetical protein
LQALLLLKQTLEGPHSVGVLNLNSHYVQFHQFREIVFGMPSDQAFLVFELKFEDFEVGFKVGFAKEPNELSWSRYDQERKWPDLLEFYVNGQQLPVDETFQRRGDPTSAYRGPAFGLIPSSFFHQYNDYYKKLYKFFESIGYIQPIRPIPERYYDLHGIKPSWIGTQAENLADFLKANPSVRKKVRDWFVKSTRLASDVKFKSDSSYGLMEILFTEATTGLEIDISRLGFGFSQILPIVVATFSDMNMLIFEAPEIHLNPNLHGDLTDLFIEGANNGKQILVETHSEHIIYRIQRRVADGTIAPEDVAIYYVSRGQDGSTARRLTLTTEGEVPDWPDGFFEAEMEDIYERVVALKHP